MRGKMRKKFICPKCGEEIGAHVIDTLPFFGGFRRWRKCEECGVVFVTSEKISYISRTRGGTADERQAGG